MFLTGRLCYIRHTYLIWMLCSFQQEWWVLGSLSSHFDRVVFASGTTPNDSTTPLEERKEMKTNCIRRLCENRKDYVYIVKQHAFLIMPVYQARSTTHLKLLQYLIMSSSWVLAPTREDCHPENLNVVNPCAVMEGFQSNRFCWKFFFLCAESHSLIHDRSALYHRAVSLWLHVIELTSYN